MSFTQEDLEHLSKLARISLSDTQKEKMFHDMQAILGYVSEVNEIVIPDGDSEKSHYNIVREDVISNETGKKTEAILSNAPEREGDYVKVPLVLK